MPFIEPMEPEPEISAIEAIDDWQYKNKITDDELWAIFEMGKAALAALKEGIPPFDLRWNPDPDDTGIEPPGIFYPKDLGDDGLSF